MTVGLVQRARIILIDDHPLFREGLAVGLRGEADLEVVGEVGSAAAALALARTTQIDLAVVDILMPDASGITFTGELFELQPACKVLGLSVIDDPGIVADMLRARACGYANKAQPVLEIIDAIRQVLGGLRYLSPHVSHDAIDAELVDQPMRQLARLTRHERQVFELLICGRSNDQIAMAFAISRRTVETHRQRIMNKLSAHTLVEMQRISARHGGPAL